tara:strand:+ start:171256 stop:171744 length:489 start_codon:yes stop_codon:yes gene_type:complete
MSSNPELAALQHRHLRIGWTSLLVFVVLGGVLESMHGFKVDWYLAVGNETQRLLWRLAHAHGTFLSLVHIGFAATLSHMSSGIVSAEIVSSETVSPETATRGALPKFAGASLTTALIALPGGFLLGAFGGHGGDPGIGIVLVPFGLVMLVVAIIGTLRKLPR